MTLKVQGVWEAEYISAILRAEQQKNPGDRWLADVCGRIDRQISAESDRRASLRKAARST